MILSEQRDQWLDWDCSPDAVYGFAKQPHFVRLKALGRSMDPTEDDEPVRRQPCNGRGQTGSPDGAMIPRWRDGPPAGSPVIHLMVNAMGGLGPKSPQSASGKPWRGSWTHSWIPRTIFVIGTRARSYRVRHVRSSPVPWCFWLPKLQSARNGASAYRCISGNGGGSTNDGDTKRKHLPISSRVLVRRTKTDGVGYRSDVSHSRRLSSCKCDRQQCCNSTYKQSGSIRLLYWALYLTQVYHPIDSGGLFCCNLCPFGTLASSLGSWWGHWLGRGDNH